MDRAEKLVYMYCNEKILSAIEDGAYEESMLAGLMIVAQMMKSISILVEHNVPMLKLNKISPCKKKIRMNTSTNNGKM